MDLQAQILYGTNAMIPQDTARELNLVRQALDQSAIVAITDRSGNIIHVNDKFCEISQYSRQELLGQNHRIINSGYHSPDFFAQLWATISAGETWEGEIRNRAKDGSYYWVYTTIVPFRNEEGSPYQFVSIRYETTQRKEAEDQLREYADQLERSNQEIKESSAKILDREAQILMQDRLASVGLMASSLAHEIGTPLGVIRGRAELLERQFAENPQAKKNLDAIVSQIDRVSKLIRSLLTLARGEQRHAPEPVSLPAVAEEVLELMGHEFRRRGVQLENHLPSRLLVRAEAGPLHQVLLNLLVNSLHALEGRTGAMVELAAEQTPEKVILSVKDNGCGISPENLKQLFRPFFTTKDVGQGTGLGLATSYRIVESWGGTISAESQLGKGTTFHVAMPPA